MVLPSADWLVSRGRLLGRARTDWRRWLLDRVPDGDELLRNHAAGPCVRAHETGHAPPGTWACATPVYLVAALDRLQLSPEAIVLPATEAAALARSINDHFATRGFRIHARATGPWLLECPGSVECSTVEPSEATGRNLRDHMPGGRDGLRLRALMNEMQMLLHEHPVNLTRASRGDAPVNSLWLWGFGQVADPGRMPARCGAFLPPLFTDDPWLAGLWCMHGEQSGEVAAFCAAGTDHDATSLVGWTVAPGTQPGPAIAAAETLAFAPARAALQARSVDEVGLLVGASAFATDHWARWRFWRPRKPLAEAVA